MKNGRRNTAPNSRGTLCRKAGAALCLGFLTWAALIQCPAAGAIELSDTPIFGQVIPPPPNIMFLVDDSWSMDREMLCEGPFHRGDFKYPYWEVPQNGPAKWVESLGRYVFDDAGDYTSPYTSNKSDYLGPEGRTLWKTQWYKTNLLYYNPNRTYSPWPSYPGKTFSDADTVLPRSDPNRSGYTLGLGSESFKVGTTSIPHAHYFMYSESEKAPYLVVVDGGKTYYKVTVKKHEHAKTEDEKLWWEEVSGLEKKTSPPDDVVSARTYSEERQNFANWYSYHRRREFVAKNALAHLLGNMKNVRVGFYGINSYKGQENHGKKPILSTLKPVKVASGNTVADKTAELLADLYGYRSYGYTPLKTGLDLVGKFYKQKDNGNLPETDKKDPAAPFEAACQRSFAVIITDGFYSDVNAKPLPTADKNADGDNGAPYADGWEQTLADVAMYYYENDLRPDLNDDVPKTPGDTNSAQHMVTYAITFGVSGTLNPNDYLNLKHKITGQWVVWPNPATAEARTDDLWHAAVNGRGQFYSARDPEQLYGAFENLREALAEVTMASAASVGVNGDLLYGKNSGSTRVYQSSYSTEKGEWKGDLRAYGLDAATGKVNTGSDWSAAERLDARAWDGRVIATYDSANKKGIAFRHDQLTAAQVDSLGGPGKVEKTVRYLRGDHVPGYRPRTTKLGDIVNSGAVFENDVIYSGANDGMLHAFSALTGEEIFAYVPHLVFGNLFQLTDPNYYHRFYVDLPPTVKKAKGILQANQDGTLLVGGLRKGGKGYFALDITDAKSLSSEPALAGIVLWEFPNPVDADMGFSYGKPVIVRSNSSAYPWVVIFANGYDSGSGKSVLYVVDAKTGSLVKKIPAGDGPDNGLSSPVAVDADYDEKVDFVYAGDLHGKLWKFDLTDTKASPDWKVAYADASGKATPLFHAKGPKVEPGFPAGTVQPITTRPDVMRHPQKKGYLVAFGTGQLLGLPDYSNSQPQSIYGIWDYGDPIYDSAAKIYSPADPREYVGAFNRWATPPLSNPSHPDTVALVQQTLLDVTYGGATYRLLTQKKPDWATSADTDAGQNPNPAKSIGYVVDLRPRERVVSEVIIRGGILMAVGFTPSDDPCKNAGSSMFMELNAFTGGRLGGPQFDITGDGVIDAKDLVKTSFDGLSDLAPSGIGYAGNVMPPAILRINDGIEKKYLSSSTGVIEELVEKAIKLGVTYWMEVRY
jgi:type IV pilus assembly protein PilY1